MTSPLPEAFEFVSPHLAMLWSNSNLLPVLMLPDERKVMSSPVEQAPRELHSDESRETGKC